MNRDAAIEAGARALVKSQYPQHRGEVDSEVRTLFEQDTAAVIDAALPHLVGEPVGYGVVTPLGRAVSVCATLDGAQHLRDLMSEDSEGGLRVVAMIPVDEPCLPHLVPDVETIAATLALSYGSHVSPPRGGRDWKAAEAVHALLIPVVEP